MNIFDRHYEDYDFADGTPGSVPPAASLQTAFAVPLNQWCARILRGVAGLSAYWERNAAILYGGPGQTSVQGAGGGAAGRSLSIRALHLDHAVCEDLLGGPK